jgi:hypothetical protein
MANFIAKVQEEEVDKDHNLFKAPFLATMAMTYDVMPTFIEFIMTQALMMMRVAASSHGHDVIEHQKKGSMVNRSLVKLH